MVNPLARYSALRFVTTNNPFYLLSILCVLYGLHQSFRNAIDEANCWLLMAILAGYTILLALVSLLIVRKGQVWDDARSIMLALPLLFAGMSVCFDELLVAGSISGWQLALCGLVLSITVSEMVLWGLRMRLPLLFRAPYYLLLAHLFLYPAALSFVLNHEVLSTYAHGYAVTWGVLIHAALGGVLLLTLLPAIRYGQRRMQDNGTPWRWPWYPLPLYLILGIALSCRTYLLSLAFGVEQFEPCFLVPYLLAAFILCLELAISCRQRDWQDILQCTAPLLLLVAVPWTISAESGFYAEITNVVGSPLWLTMWSLVFFYAYAWLRNANGAEAGMILALLGASMLLPETVNWSGIVYPHAAPLLMIAMLQFCLALGDSRSQRWLLVAMSLLAALCFEFHDSPLMSYGGALPLHLLWLSMLLIGAVCQDGFANFLRAIAGLVGVCLCLLPWLVTEFFDATELQPSLAILYAVAQTGICWGYWYLICERSDRIFLTAYLTNGASFFTLTGMRGYLALQQTVFSKGLENLALGTLFLAAAVVISLHKAGLLVPFWRRILPVTGSENRQIADAS